MTRELEFTKMHGAGNDFVVLDGIAQELPPLEPLARRLEVAHGVVELGPRRDPVDGLIMTILSQATNDTNSLHAFQRLKARFPSWDELLASPVGELEAAIRPAGLSRNKSRTIHRILEILQDRVRHGERQIVVQADDPARFPTLLSDTEGWSLEPLPLEEIFIEMVRKPLKS